MSPTSNWAIASVRDALRTKEISARELTSEFYARIEKRNPELNAYLALSRTGLRAGGSNRRMWPGAKICPHSRACLWR